MTKGADRGVRDPDVAAGQGKGQPPRRGATAEASTLGLGVRVGSTVVVIVVCSAALVESRDFPNISGLYSGVVAALALALALVTLVVDLRQWWLARRAATGESATPSGGLDVEREVALDGFVLRRAFRFLAWLLAYGVAIWLVGFLASSGVFVTVFLLIEGRAGVVRSLIGGVATVAFLWVFSQGINVRWPPSVVDLLGWLR